MDAETPSGADRAIPRSIAVPVRDAVLEAECFGAGAPVVVVQTALTADELLPLAAALGRSGDLQVVHLHRRGYAPVLSVGGEQSGPWFTDARALLRTWLPQLEQATVSGAGHLVGATHAEQVAGLLAAFMRRHPSVPRHG